MNNKPSKELTDLTAMKRNDVVPYYLDMLVSGATRAEVIRINNLIMARWSVAALIYIKEAAWKAYYALQDNTPVTAELVQP